MQTFYSAKVILVSDIVRELKFQSILMRFSTQCEVFVTYKLSGMDKVVVYQKSWFSSKWPAIVREFHSSLHAFIIRNCVRVSLCQ